MTTTHWTAKLKALGACEEAVAWARKYPTYAAAWAACERADWLLWLAGKLVTRAGSSQHRAVVRAALACAKTAWPHVREQDRPAVRRCYRGTAAWLRGDADLSAVQAAANAAYAAYAASNAAYAAYAAYAASNAAANAANAAAYAAANAASNAAAVYADLAALAKVVRRHVPRPRLPSRKAPHADL